MNLKNYKNAIFFAEKLVSIDPKMKEFVYLLGECYFMNQDYKKVHLLFKKQDMLFKNQEFQILAARSLLNNKSYDACLSVLN
jgi:hypothetical protein